MLKVNLRDGRTVEFDLDDETARGEWNVAQADAAFQSQITGIGIHHGGTLHVLPIPIRFRRVSFSASALMGRGEVIGQQVECHADDVRTTLSVYYSGGTRPRMVRVNVMRIGRPRFLTNRVSPQQDVAGRRDRMAEG